MIVPRSPIDGHGESRTCQSDSAFQTLPIPATSRWSSSASPSSRLWCSLRRFATIPAKSGGSARMSGPRRRALRLVSSSTGPFQSTASRLAPVSTSQGLPCFWAPRSTTCQRPLMRRWLRSTRPPSKLSSRFFPTASTASSLRPSRRSAASTEAARGWGVSTVTRSPTSACSLRAARWSESPSGIARTLAGSVCHAWMAMGAPTGAPFAYALTARVRRGRDSSSVRCGSCSSAAEPLGRDSGRS